MLCHGEVHPCYGEANSLSKIFYGEEQLYGMVDRRNTDHFLWTRLLHWGDALFLQVLLYLLFIDWVHGNTPPQLLKLFWDGHREQVWMPLCRRIIYSLRFYPTLRQHVQSTLDSKVFRSAWLHDLNCKQEDLPLGDGQMLEECVLILHDFIS